MEILSEHLCQGWLEGYLLTGRHGFFSCYEAFIHIIDAMFNQHAKWLKVNRDLPWRASDSVSQLPAHLSCVAPGSQRVHAPGSGFHRPRREQEGGDGPRVPSSGHQHVAFDRRPLPAISRDYVNVIVAGKQPCLQDLFFDVQDSIRHCTRGLGVLEVGK